ncbi:MAG: 4Fe-4S dicluster domain-containing protein [Coriobacteriales bacterium]|jgi:ferredoxin-type protein NapG|nr:4Fe-4S dicluster domain-containing protein [Coriobacteriales bacterium]
MDKDAASDAQGIGAPTGVSRRNLLIGLGGTAAFMGLGAMRYVGSTPLCRPPGGQDEDALLSACVRCEKCYEVCPRKVIVPAHLEDGLLGVRSPTLDFSDDFCDFCVEENGGDPLCVRVCPTGALGLPSDSGPENTIVGLAVIDEGTCLAYRDTSCRYCYDACPYEAMELSSDTRSPRPRVIAEKCNGCGACESVCVSLEAASIATGATERAIVVRAVEASNRRSLS